MNCPLSPLVQEVHSINLFADILFFPHRVSWKYYLHLCLIRPLANCLEMLTFFRT